jgi:tetratricopeptide (TPR) repeat protein
MKLTYTIGTTLLIFMFQSAMAQDVATPEEIMKHQGHYYRLSESGQWQEAMTHAQQAYTLGQSVYGATSPEQAKLSEQLGHALVQLGDVNGITPLNEALTIYTQTYGDKSEKLITVLMDIGSAQTLMGRYDQSEDNFDRAFDLAKDVFGRDSTMIAKLNMQAGNSFASQNEFQTASDYFTDAYEIYEGMYGPFSSKTGEAAYQLAEMDRMTGNARGMTAFLKKTIATFEDPTTPANEFERTVHRKLVEAYHAIGKPKKATQHVIALASAAPETQGGEPELVVRPQLALDQNDRDSLPEGYVRVSYDIDSEGFVRNAKLIDYQGGRKLVDSAMKALDGYRYIPASQNGQPVGTNGLETMITFKNDG